MASPHKKTPPQVLRLQRRLEGLIKRYAKILRTLKKCIIRDYEKIDSCKKSIGSLIKTQDRLLANVEDVRTESEVGIEFALDQYCHLCNDKRTLKCHQCLLYSFLKTGHKWKKGLESERIGCNMGVSNTAKYKGGSNAV